MSKKKLCPCCSQKEYDQCCRLFHEGKLPMRPLELMRSRYSAYALNFPDYIMETTHPANPYYSKDTLSWRRSISEFSKSSSFEKLEILATSEKEATVTFTAYIIQDSKDLSFTEKVILKKWVADGSIAMVNCLRGARSYPNKFMLIFDFS